MYPELRRPARPSAELSHGSESPRPKGICTDFLRRLDD